MEAFGGCSSSGAPESVGASRRRDGLAILLAGAVFRIVLLLVFPEPYGEDGFGRIYFKDRIFLSHWLPLTQVLVYAAGWLTQGAFWIRLEFALLGAAAACGFYAYLRQIMGREAALAGGLIFTFNPLTVTLSLMPYQDILFLGLHYAALAWLFPGRPDGEGTLSSWRGSGFYGLACLTRYEGWFALPLLAFWKLAREARAATAAGKLKAAVRTAVFFGWAPAVWFFLSFLRWRGWNEFLFQTPDGRFYGWHPHFDLEWAVGYAGRWLYWMLRFGFPPVVLLAAWGAVLLWRGRRRLDPSLKLLLANGAIVVLFFFFVIGQRQETVFRFVTFPLSIVLVLAALGLDGLWAAWRRAVAGRSARAAWATLAVAAMALYTAVPLAEMVAEPRHRDPYRIARFLEDRLQSGERVLVSADRSRDLQDDAPLLFQRIVAQARIDREAFESAGNLEFSDPGRLLGYLRRRGVRYLVVFENFQPWRPVDVQVRAWADSDPEWLAEELRTGEARVLRVREWPSP